MSGVDWDVLICGGGMAGLTLALQLRRELPSLRVAVVERSERPLPATTHKVGESNAELGSLYLDGLGLKEYLRRDHVVKLGLRFFPGGGDRPLEERTEMGPSQEPVVRGYQIDRGRFEQDLRGLVEDAGAELIEGAMVREVELGKGDERHRVVVERGGERQHHSARWVVDGTGRSALFRRNFQEKRGINHPGNAAWFRIEGRLQLDELTADATQAWRDVPLASERWRSTNHLMGNGYWVWLIGLANDRTSIGVVTHDAVYGFDSIRTIERAMAFLREHEPGLAERLDDVEVLDFQCIHGYGHRTDRFWSTDRWAIIGDAAAFTDPLYSPGTDFIALSNSFTVELVKADEAGEELDALVDGYDAEYQRLVEGSTEVYRQAAPVYGHPRAMVTKIYYDNFSYWSYNCQYYIQGLYKLRGEDAERVRAMRRRFIDLSGHVQTLLSTWATAYPDAPAAAFLPVPSFPSLAIDAHLDLEKRMAPAEAMELMRSRLSQAEEMVAELAVRVLFEYGPDAGAELLAEAGFKDWGLELDPARAESESTIGLARRRALSRVVRDVERSLGRVHKHPQWKQALLLAGEG